jgi:tripartite-type tricarboxylate transporter receptor subunit TctC
MSPLRSPTTRPSLAKLGSEPLIVSPGEFGNILREEVQKWGRVIKSAGITME